MRAQDRRRQLLEVAADLFARYGYRGTTTARLAEAAGITEPILYRHFDNKQDLFVTLVEEVGREVIVSWRDALADVDDPDQRLRVILAGNPATHARGRGIYRVIFQAMSEVDGHPEIGRAIRRHVTGLHEFLETELSHLQRSGAVRGDQSAASLAWLLIHVAIGTGMVQPLGLRRTSTQEARAMMPEILRELVGA